MANSAKHVRKGAILGLWLWTGHAFSASAALFVLVAGAAGIVQWRTMSVANSQSQPAYSRLADAEIDDGETKTNNTIPIQQ